MACHLSHALSSNRAPALGTGADPLLAATGSDWPYEAQALGKAVHRPLAQALDVLLARGCSSLQAQGLLLLQLPQLLQEHRYLPDVATCQVSSPQPALLPASLRCCVAALLPRFTAAVACDTQDTPRCTLTVGMVTHSTCMLTPRMQRRTTCLQCLSISAIHRLRLPLLPQALLAGLGYDLNYAELLQAVQPEARPWLLGNLLAASLQEPERQSMVTWHLLRLVAEPTHLPPQVSCS